MKIGLTSILSEPTRNRRGRYAVIGAIRAYQQWIRPAFPPSCRFTPSCSQYAVECVDRHGVVRGLWFAALRLLRCHPFHPGGFDPVP